MSFAPIKEEKSYAFGNPSKAGTLVGKVLRTVGNTASRIIKGGDKTTSNMKAAESLYKSSQSDVGNQTKGLSYKLASK